jgi:monoamine oxidase
VKRRKAIQQIGLGVSASLVLPSWLSSCNEYEQNPSIQYDGIVGVIGAGVAGLYAADILNAKGINVKVFEASSRVGGRIKNLRPTDQASESLLFDPANFPNNDFPTELGAERIIGSDSAWAKIINELKIPAIESSTLGTDNYFLDNAFAEGSAAKNDADFIAAKNFVDQLASYSGNNVSVQQAIQNQSISARVHAILNSWLGNTHGTSNSQLGITALSEATALRTRNAIQLTLKQNPMEDALLSRFSAIIPKVELNSAIRSLNYSGEKIILTGLRNGTESFTQEFDKVIVAIPLSILKANEVEFSPSLPSTKTTVLSRMGMDACIRLVFEYKANFWGDASGFLYGGIASPEYFNTGIGRSMQTKTMNITIAGSKAEELSALGPAMVPVVIEELDSIFSGKATQNIRRDDKDNIITVIQDWTKEPFIKGGTSYVKAGGTNQDRIDLASPVNEKLFFAGEATDISGDAGTINGALLSAERAAQEVVDTVM